MEMKALMEIKITIPCSRSGGAVVRRYPSSKVRSSGCAFLEPREEIPHVKHKRNPSKTVGAARGIRGQPLKPQSRNCLYTFANSQVGMNVSLFLDPPFCCRDLFG